MTWADQWADAVVQSVTQLGVTVAGFIPKFLGMLIILIVGYVVSRIIARIVAAVLRKMGFDRASAKIGLMAILERGNIKVGPSHIVGRLAFWFILLTFFVSAADTIGLGNVSRTIDSFVAYLPNVVGAVGIAVVGLLLASFVRDAVRRGADGIGVEYADALSKVAYAVLVILVITLAVGQLKINLALVDRVIEILLIAAGAGLALTLGLGTRDLSKNIVAGVYARDTYTPGMQLTVGSHSGSLEEVGTISTKIRTASGEAVYVPNGQFLEVVVRGTEADTPVR